MILLKFEKKENFIYISHVDMLRHFQRTFRRAGIGVKFSNGFHPHMLTYFSAPLPLGLTSKAEYSAIVTDMQADEFLEKYNKNCPMGIRGLSAVNIDVNPNLQFNIFAAKYDFNILIEKKDKYVITYMKKGEEIIEDVTEKVFDVDGTFAILKAGQDTLRPDRFLNNVNITKVIKTNQYLKEGEKLVDIDEVFALR